MKRISVLLVAAVSAVASSAFAGDFTSYHVGNSLTEDLMGWYTNMGFRKLARDYVQAQPSSTYSWGWHDYHGQSLTTIHNSPASYDSVRLRYDTAAKLEGTPTSPQQSAQWNYALPGNHWDLVTLEPYPFGGAGGNSNATVATDTTSINDMITETRKGPNNANTRFYIYAAWPKITTGVTGSFRTAYLNTTIRDGTDAEYSALSRVYWHNLTDRVRQTNPGVSVIPVGEVFNALDEQMQQPGSQFQNLHSALDLYRDQYHTNAIGENIAAWTAYATVFKQDIRLNGGMPFLDPSATPMTLSDNDRHLIQSTIMQVLNDNIAYTSVPEPTSLAILGVGGMLLMRRRKSA